MGPFPIWLHKLHSEIPFEFLKRKMMETNVRSFRVLAFVLIFNGLSLINIPYLLKIVVIPVSVYVLVSVFDYVSAGLLSLHLNHGRLCLRIVHTIC